MTIKELIEKLQEYSPTVEVTFMDSEYGETDVNTITYIEKHNIIVLEE